MCRILTVQDISCVGQCSITVALPIISAFGVETSILPGAILSTHTGGFSGFTFRDLSDDMPAVCDHWEKEKIDFDAVYTGYLGNAKQVDCILDISKRLLKKGGKLIVDPAMADYGKLYTGFDLAFVAEMRRLCAHADYVLPNLSEASFLLDIPYKTEGYDEKYVLDICKGLYDLGAKNVVLTGVSYEKDKLGVAIYDGEKIEYYFHKRESRNSHGTGDVYASAFCGSLMRGKTAYQAAAFAADFTVRAIQETPADHTYGVRFEKAIPLIVSETGDNK